MVSDTVRSSGLTVCGWSLSSGARPTSDYLRQTGCAKPSRSLTLRKPAKNPRCWRRGRDRRWRRREEAEGEGLGRDRRAKNYRSGLPKEVGAPETGNTSQSDLLTPQGKDLSPWHLKTG